MSLDQKALREKYREERERRLRRGGVEQYRQSTGALSDFAKDPHADPNFAREPQSRSVEVLVIGGGMGGLMMGAQLRQKGIDNFLIVDRAADFGGVWYWNRYPGAGCDTESYIYLPLLEETGYLPKEKYAKSPEIREHLQRVGRHFNLYERALLQTAVTEMRWDDAQKHWRVETDRNDALTARFVVNATGVMTRPKLPGIPGIERFEGERFHTARWNFDYTGGSTAGGLEKLKDKRVGVIGTGATAVQCIPHLGEWSKELLVFQRTPSAINRRDNRPTDPDWAASLQPGWQRERMANFTAVVSGDPFEVDLVKDGWTEMIGEVLLAAKREFDAGRKTEAPAVLMQRADDTSMDKVRRRVDEEIKNPETAEALKPWYGAFCKRGCFHDEFLATFNRPNVRLIDTKGAGVEEITETGVVVAGKAYPLDCLVFATGFAIEGADPGGQGYEIYGREGLALSEKRREKWRTLHGYMTRDFPNYLMMSYSQTGQSPNFQHILDEQSRHLAYILSRAQSVGIATLEPEAEAENAWAEEVVRAAKGRTAYLKECTPGYYNAEGGINEHTVLNGPYWKSPTRFFGMTKAWREENALAGLEIDRPSNVA